LLIYAFAFHAFALWAQLALFAGCATKGDDKYYVFSGNALSFDREGNLYATDTGITGGLFNPPVPTKGKTHGRR